MGNGGLTFNFNHFGRDEMKNITLQQWLDEMDKLDREATNVEEWETDLASDSQRMIAYALGPKSFFRNSFDREPIYQSQKDEEFIKKSRTELPRAVRLIKDQEQLIENLLLALSQVDNLHEGFAVTRRNELKYRQYKILNEEVG